MHSSLALSNSWLLYAFVVLLIAFIWTLILRHKSNPFTENGKLPYRRQKIMTVPEMMAYECLLNALPQYMIFAQVQVSRVIGAEGKDNRYWFNFINRLSYDFLICRTDGTPIAAIEIDDRSHLLPQRQEADQRKNRATIAAGIAMIRWQHNALPSSKEIQQIITNIDRKSR